jgi:hypothetical protein
MQHDPTDEDQDDQDRVVSRRVDHPTAADPGDRSVYQAANPDDGDGPPDSPARAEPDAGSTTQSAANELDEADESEPERSE